MHRHSPVIAVLLVAAPILLAGVGRSQVEVPDPVPERLPHVEGAHVPPASVPEESESSGQSPANPRPPGGAVVPLDEETREQYLAALRGYYRYTLEAQVHRGKVFAWQYASSIVIFVVVILLVVIGIYFSWMQFRQSLEPSPRKTKPVQEAKTTEGARDARPAGELPLTTVKAGAEGIEVSSPVLGVIILALSLAFFYLYLAYVYPINEVF